MIRHIEVDDSVVAAARTATSVLGFLRSSPKEGITIAASNGSVTIDSVILGQMVDLIGRIAEDASTAGGENELTPQEAAEILNMSRPTVMRLIAAGKLGARQVGSHHRLSEAEVLKFKAEQATIRRRGLDDLAAFTQDFDR